MKKENLGFIGGGRITRIFLQAFKNKSTGFESIKVYDPDSRVMDLLKKEYTDVIPAGSAFEAAKQDLVFLAVHPPVMTETLNAIKEVVSRETIVVSLAPKITIEKISSILPESRILRLIPNATSFINEGYNPVSFQKSFSEEERKPVLEIIEVLGDTFEVEEHKLEGYAIASAMLPTYFWFQWKKMEEIALKTGLTEKEAAETIKNSLDKSLRLLYESGLSYEEVIDLIPVKPIGDKEKEIESIYEEKLLGLFEKISPEEV